MSRVTRRQFVGRLGASATLLAARRSADAAPTKPNIVFILIDDLGWADLGCYGSEYYETPHIDRLARQGMRFTQAYAACPACSPTRASILTGKHPARLRLTDWIPGWHRKGAKLDPPKWRKFLGTEEVTVAEALKAAGYATAAIGKWHLGGKPHSPERHGFDLNIAGSHIGLPPSYFHPYGKGAQGVPGLADGKPGEYLTDRLTAEAERFIESSRDRPFFLYLCHYAVHTPIQAKSDLIEKYRERKGSKGQASPAYAAMVESVDQSVGRIMAKLDALGLADDTLVIFFSDNGGLVRKQATSNAPLRSGKGFAYEGGVRVPLIVRWPRAVRPGSICREAVASTDFYPTLLEIAHVAGDAEHNEHLDGASILPLLRQSGKLGRRTLYWHYPHYNPIGGVPYGAVREGDWKLIEFFEDGRLELYNLKDDLGETTNLAARAPDRAAGLRARLDAWRKDVKAQMPRRTPPPTPDLHGQ